MPTAAMTREELRSLLSSRADEFTDFLLRYVDQHEGLRRSLLEFADSARREQNISSVQRLEEEDTYMVGESPQMKVVFDAIRKFSVTDVPVLLTGETGTGKELVALAIHERSSAAAGPFVAVNCGALPPTLIASELFGHEKGAFTGAHQRRIGKLEAAARGTIFLDEVGDLPLDLQPHLLRFLQERTIDRLGGSHSIEVNARVIAATNTDLSQAVREARFREDLFYRLNVLAIDMPPLRERGDDVTLLAMFFARKIAAEMNRSVRGFQCDALQALREYSWPGNVRELISRVRRAIVLSDHEWLSRRDLGFDHKGGATDSKVKPRAILEIETIEADPMVMSLEQAKERLEAALVRTALARANGSVTLAAHELGVSRVWMYRLMEKYGLGSARSRAH